MIKRLFLLFAIVLTASSLFAAIETYTQSIPVSFTYDIVANYGFTKKHVNDYVKPGAETVADSVINFKYDSAKKQLKTDDFYFYYQIFTPDAITIKMTLSNLTSEGKNPVSYSSVDKYDFASVSDGKLKSGGSEYTIYHADKFSSTTDHFSPVVSSTLLCFVVDDISKVDWTADYSATVTLSMVVS